MQWEQIVQSFYQAYVSADRNCFKNRWPSICLTLPSIKKISSPHIQCVLTEYLYSKCNMTLQELLNLKMPELATKKVKLVRHADSRSKYDFKFIRKNRDRLLQYQSEQSKPVFENCDYIVSFLGTESTQSLLLGVFKVNGVKEVDSNDHKYVYDLELVNTNNLNDDFYERLVIDWGKATTAWVQWYEQEKPVVELLPKGYIGEFPGYLEFSFDCFDLERLAENSSANKIWITKLSSVNGIYLIVDRVSGRQYVGSAYGKDGIWGRWLQYAKTRHGGNVKLIEMMEEEPLCYHSFTYSILQTLPSNLSEKEVRAYENLYKEKLGTRAHGLNLN